MRSKVAALIAMFMALRGIGCSDDAEEKIEETPFSDTEIPEELSVTVEDACKKYGLAQVTFDARIVLRGSEGGKCPRLDARVFVNANGLFSEVQQPGPASFSSYHWETNDDACNWRGDGDNVQTVTPYCQSEGVYKDIVRADPSTYDVRFETGGKVRHLTFRVDAEIDISLAESKLRSSEGLTTMSGNSELRVCYTAGTHITRCDARHCRVGPLAVWAYRSKGTP